MRARTLISLVAATGAATFGYASVIERNWFALRRVSVPGVLPQGAAPLKVLHLSDAHLTPGRHRLMSFIRSLDALEPDLVVNTGDSIASPAAVSPFLDALGPLLERPGAFVYGTNDLFSPHFANPLRYLWRSSSGEHDRRPVDLPWEELGTGMTAAGWLDLNNRKGRLKAGDLDIAFAGTHDAHSGRDLYGRVAGQADPGADLRLGVLHSPEPRLLDRFAADGYELLLAGHTHGGQVRVPGFGTLTTNCGIDRAQASGLSLHPQVARPDGTTAWLHVSAGLGTSPYAPVRFACRPEATLLTLLPRLNACASRTGYPLD